MEQSSELKANSVGAAPNAPPEIVTPVKQMKLPSKNRLFPSLANGLGSASESHIAAFCELSSF
jgi:hypothetical protein